MTCLLEPVFSPHLPSIPHIESLLQPSDDDNDSASTAVANPSLDAAPSIIVLLTWVNAHPRHIDKYVQGNLRLFPNSRIIVITSQLQDFMYHSKASQEEQLCEAAKLLVAEHQHSKRAHSSDSTSETPQKGRQRSRILIHLFSNGGAQKLWLLGRACLKLMQASSSSHSDPEDSFSLGDLFPTAIFDSSPGHLHFRRANAMCRDILSQKGIARIPMRAGIVGAIGTLWTARRLEIRDDVTEFWEGLNDRESWHGQCHDDDTSGTGLYDSPATDVARGQRSYDHVPVRRVRCYIYSDQDQTIQAKDVERHAYEARTKGWWVRTEKFHGSGHVQHLKLDPERYWDVVSDFWRSSLRNNYESVLWH